MKKQKIDWIIHLVANGVCEECGREEQLFLTYTCNAHTHGMEKYGHPDFQLVLAYPKEEICRILNTMGLRVQAGERFQAGDPAEMAARCGLPYDGERRAVDITLLGETFSVSHPDFTITGPSPLTNAERILFLRYLLDGRKSQPLGQYLTYRDFPWGEVYLQQFTGRCIKRFAFSYGSRLDLLEKIMEKLPAKKLSRSDCGWELELMEGLTIQFLLWAGDEEFPPNAQIMFSDNFRYAFTAEDLANAGDIVLNRMKRIGAGL